MFRGRLNGGRLVEFVLDDAVLLGESLHVNILNLVDLRVQVLLNVVNVVVVLFGQSSRSREEESGLHGDVFEVEWTVSSYFLFLALSNFQ